ncbi:MAG: DNA-binding response regulator [marine bacterium B5-7]|nr:MAG: DNA-binding response regulator [marine bacterium B5-7]
MIMDPSNTIMIVDDDPDIRSLMASYLEKNGYRSVTVADGRQMHAALDRHHVDLIVLDLMLPGENGLDLCRNLRANTSIPIIMLTARSEDTDRIVGLEMGADDYLPKPFNPRELLARIRAVLRRSRSLNVGSTQGTLNETSPGFAFGNWRLDTRTRSLKDFDEVETPLSAAEYNLLLVFLTHPGRVLERDQLLDLTRGRDATPFDRSIDMQVSRLRKRLGAGDATIEYIKTVRSQGYLFIADVRPICK